jgi:hypothetical protein
MRYPFLAGRTDAFRGSCLSTQRNGPRRGSNPQPSGHGADVLITEPPVKGVFLMALTKDNRRDVHHYIHKLKPQNYD